MHHLLRCSFLGLIALWLMSAFPSSPHLGRIFPQLGYPQLPLSSIGSIIVHALSYGGGALVLRPKPYRRSNSRQFNLVVPISVVLHSDFV